MSEIRFPHFCESASGKSFYRIDAPDEMTEYQLIGSRYAIHFLKAKILPERNLLMDMLQNHEGRYPPISKAHFETKRAMLERMERIG